jgi:hypothetical protein
MSNPLTVVEPLEVTDAVLVASSLPEDDAPAWVAGTSYALGVKVLRNHRVYESAVANNQGADPANNPVRWIDKGPSNRWAVFDTVNGTRSKAPSGSMSFTLLLPRSVSILACLNVVGCATVNLRIQHPVFGLLYEQTHLLGSVPAQAGWWEWLAGNRTAPDMLMLRGLPGFVGSTMTVTFTGSEVLGVGILVLGEGREIGMGVTSARTGIQDFSRKERNAFGDAILVERAYAKRASFQLKVLTPRVHEDSEYLASLRAKPCLWIGSVQYGSTVIYGFYQTFEMLIERETITDCSLDIEGLT